MKKCIRCKQDQPETEFYIKKNRPTPYTECKACMNTRNIARLTRVKIELVNYKGGKCELCGYSKNIKALEFHHKNAIEKDFSIASVKNHSIENLKPEVDKCMLVCANCHREEHDRLWRESATTNWEVYNELLDDWSSVKADPKTRQTKKYNELDFLCLKCGTQTKAPNKLCIKCGHQKQEKINWPSNEELLARLKSSNYTRLAKELGVSDNAIRNRLKT